jgi:RimJ/RimL family protein N-acetyltransferase
MSPADADVFQAHFERTILESGQDGIYFMPFDTQSGDRPRGVDFSALDKQTSEPGWQRWFVAVDEQAGIIGHVDLKGAGIRSGLHRCVLGVGIEKPWRGQGLGERLMNTAIEFARSIPQIHWVDLGVFSGNERVKALYDRLGFEEIGRREDCFRIGEVSVTDILMTLALTHNKR